MSSYLINTKQMDFNMSFLLTKNKGKNAYNATTIIIVRKQLNKNSY